jgi:hypothetical protein
MNEAPYDPASLMRIFGVYLERRHPETGAIASKLSPAPEKQYGCCKYP